MESNLILEGRTHSLNQKNAGAKRRVRKTALDLADVVLSAVDALGHVALKQARCLAGRS